MSYNITLFSGKNFALCATNKKYSNSCVVRKLNSERNKKPYPPSPSSQMVGPLVVKGLTWKNMTEQKLSKLGFPERGKYWTFKLAYRRGHWTWRLWLNHWKNICFYSFTLYLWLPFFLHWPLKFEFSHQIFGVLTKFESWVTG